MKTVLAAILGVVLATATPAGAYIVAVTTSVDATAIDTREQLQRALASAIDDVLSHAIGFSPTAVTLQSLRVVGDRIYILLLIVDDDGLRTLEDISAGRVAPDGERGGGVPGIAPLVL